MNTPSSVIPFQFNDKPIRTFIASDGEPRFVASDVCRILEISDVKQAIERLDDDERGRYDVPTGGGIQATTCITEAGLYRLIFTSRKPQAEEFKKWIARDVLPSIRKTGSFSLQQMTPAEIILMQAQKLVDLEREQMTQAQAIKRIETRQDDLETVNYWLAVRRGAGKFLTNSLPDGDKD